MEEEREKKMMMMIKHNLVMQKQNSKRQLRQVRTSQPSPMLVYPRHHHLFWLCYKRLRARVMGGIRSRHFVPCSSFETFLFGWSFFQTRQTEIET